MIIALIALLLLHDRARRRRPPRRRSARSTGIPSAPSPTPAASCVLGKNQQIPRRRDPHRQKRLARRRQDRRRTRRHLPAGHGRPRHLVPRLRAVSADEGRRRQEQLHLGQQSLRGRRRLAALRRRTARRRRTRQARVHDPRLAADRDDQPGPDPRAERRTRDELDARHDRSRLGGGRLGGRQRRRHRQPPPGPGQPAAAAGQPAAWNRCST